MNGVKESWSSQAYSDLCLGRLAEPTHATWIHLTPLWNLHQHIALLKLGDMALWGLGYTQLYYKPETTGIQIMPNIANPPGTISEVLYPTSRCEQDRLHWSSAPIYSENKTTLNWPALYAFGTSCIECDLSQCHLFVITDNSDLPNVRAQLIPFWTFPYIKIWWHHLPLPLHTVNTWLLTRQCRFEFLLLFLIVQAPDKG